MGSRKGRNPFEEMKIGRDADDKITSQLFISIFKKPIHLIGCFGANQYLNPILICELVAALQNTEWSFPSLLSAQLEVSNRQALVSPGRYRAGAVEDHP